MYYYLTQSSYNSLSQAAAFNSRLSGLCQSPLRFAIHLHSLLPTPQHSSPVLFGMHAHVANVRGALELLQHGLIALTPSGSGLFFEILPINQVVLFRVTKQSQRPGRREVVLGEDPGAVGTGGLDPHGDREVVDEEQEGGAESLRELEGQGEPLRHAHRHRPAPPPDLGGEVQAAGRRVGDAEVVRQGGVWAVALAVRVERRRGEDAARVGHDVQDDTLRSAILGGEAGVNDGAHGLCPRRQCLGCRR